MDYPLSQYVRITFAVHMKFDCFIRNREAFGNLVTGLSVVLLYGCMHGLIIQNLWLATARHITKGQISWRELLETMYHGCSLKALLLNPCRIRWLDAASEKTKIKIINLTTMNKMIRHRYVASVLLKLLLMRVLKESALVKAMLHRRRSFSYQWSLLPTQHNGKVFWLTYIFNQSHIISSPVFLSTQFSQIKIVLHFIKSDGTHYHF